MLHSNGRTRSEYAQLGRGISCQNRCGSKEPWRDVAQGATKTTRDVDIIMRRRASRRACARQTTDEVRRRTPLHKVPVHEDIEN